MPSFEEFFKPENNKLSQEEVDRLMYVVDCPPKDLERVTLDNIGDAIDRGAEQFQQRRERGNVTAFSPDKHPAETLEILWNRSSENHAILCSANETEDFSAFWRHLNNFLEEQKIPENDEIRDINGFLKRHISMDKLSTELYKIDIMRRVGEEKGNKAFFQQALSRFDFKKLADKARTLVDEFEEANKDKIKDIPEIQKNIADLKMALSEENEMVLEKSFYDVICELYNHLIMIDFEKFNIQKLREAMRKLEK